MRFYLWLSDSVVPIEIAVYCDKSMKEKKII